MTSANDAARTGLVFHDRYLQHNTGLARSGSPAVPYPFAEPEPHVSSPRTVSRAKHLIDLSGLGERLTAITPRYATEEELRMVHDAAYIARVQAIAAEGGGDAGINAPLGPDGFAIAALAAGGAIAAVDAVMSGTVRNCYALVRPPGHHALADRGLGFCLFNNIAVAARHAQRTYGLRRIAIIDWDVHDGNGTQEAFYADGDVLFVSLHQEGLFPPDMGLLEQIGSGAGIGKTVNIPLSPGSGDAAYAAAIARIVAPIVRQFAPELLLISCGLDAGAFDPLGRMNLSSVGFRELTEAVLALADDCCGGRLVVVHEGGYSQTYVPACTLAIVEAMAAVAEPWTDPALSRLLRTRTRREVGLDAEQAIASAIAVQRTYWTL
ncbi:MAG TPA: class II histone deacetylase [Thermomicrobiales bacterium]